MTDWLAYRGTGRPEAATAHRRLPLPPPWRRFSGIPSDAPVPESGGFRAETFRASERDVEMVNAALYLRRPLLVTGRPGTGKSSLAHSVARELQLGEVLQWPVTSRTTRKDGLYRYDAVARLQDASINRQHPEVSASAAPDLEVPDVGRYITLGPLGTALLPRSRPRVLLVDELDKSDIDLPNDLLHLFEEGYFDIPELTRRREGRLVTVTTDDGTSVAVEGGIVRCHEFPLVIITSNGEREFPLAFLRRCLRLEMPDPDYDKLASIVEAHLGSETLEKGEWLIEQFIERGKNGALATDQLLNAVFLLQQGLIPVREERSELAALLLPFLDATTPG